MSAALAEAPTAPQSYERPERACVLHPPPRRVGAWRLADEGYRTCSDCLDHVREQLREVGTRWAVLDPRPGAQGEQGGRGAPGFGSCSPGSDHVIAMRDDRSSRSARVWIGSDGKVHRESQRPPLSVQGELGAMARFVADARGMAGPGSWDVPAVVAWLDGQLDWITRQAGVVEFARTVRELVSQLRPVTGERRAVYVGKCPNPVEQGDEVRSCGARLYAPQGSDEIREIQCRTCERRWDPSEFLHLGRTLQAA